MISKQIAIYNTLLEYNSRSDRYSATSAAMFFFASPLLCARCVKPFEQPRHKVT
jgi:hypothetical protein